MTKIRVYVLAFVGLLAVQISLGNPCTSQDDSPQQSRQDDRHEQTAIVEGTFDQMEQMEGGWYCMNRKTGYQMMLSTGNKNRADNNKYSNDIIIMNPDFKIPDELSSDRTTEASVTEEKTIAPTPKQTTIDEVRKKFADFDWVKYFKARRMTSTVPPAVDFDRFTGAGMQDVRVLH